VSTCAQCGKPLQRVHRTFFQQLHYSAAFQCAACGIAEYAPFAYKLHFGPYARCPRCGTVRIVKRRKRDLVDPMHWSFLTILERLAGGKLCHCHYCRIQFYDRRELAPEASRDT
jgi:DNA-directed RNA polymerase subunit RPC12/RpoP